MDNNKQLKLLKAQDHALFKGGQCVSKEYINTDSKLEWKCHNPKHNSWFASYYNVINRNSWCKQCNIEKSSERYVNKKGLENAKEHALSKGGQCLSTQYINNRTKMLWKCSNPNHLPWESTYNKVINIGHWCPRCVGKFPKEEKIIKAQQLAELRGGKCLSTEYVGGKKKLEWKCSNSNHNSWLAPYSAIYSGTWCPQCGIYYYKEQKIRELLEYLLKTKFPKSYFEWNINPKTNRTLELDGYSEDLKIAFEFQGKHHYEIGIFNQTKEDLEYTKYKDEIKKINCIKNGVDLIVIDDKFELSQRKEIVNYLVNVLERNYITVRDEIKQEDIDKIFQEVIDQQRLYLLEAKDFAESKDGQCLSNEYINSKKSLKWKCSIIDHAVWEATYSYVIRKNIWCPQCKKMDYREQWLKKAKEYAFSRGGECLSNEYKSAHGKLKWKCSKPNHDSWLASYDSISRGSWCFKCAKEELSNINKNKNGLIEAKKHAKSMGGLCLSIEYVNSKEKLEWKCAIKEHSSWFAAYSTVVNGKSWCPECAGRLPKEDALNILQQLAKSKGGQCLAKEYINSKAKVEWKCANPNHNTWLANYDKVSRGSWCRKCAEIEIGNSKRNKQGLEIARKHAKDKEGRCVSNEYINAHEKLEWKCSIKEHPTWTASYSKVVNSGRWCPSCAKLRRKK